MPFKTRPILRNRDRIRRRAPHSLREFSRAFPIDFNLLADGPARRITEIVSKRMPSMNAQEDGFCGLPVSVGAKPGDRPTARHEHVVRAMPRDCRRVRGREHAPFVVFKEFSAGDCAMMDFLQQLGFRRFSSPAMNTFDGRFSNMNSYTAALRSRYRQCVHKSLAKSRAAGLRYERLTDTTAILRLYDSSLHQRYEAVALSSTHRLELLPLAFFHNPGAALA